MEKENIVKKVCGELGITQRELAERIDDFGVLYDRLHALIADKTGAEPIIEIKLTRPYRKDGPIVRFSTKSED